MSQNSSKHASGSDIIYRKISRLRLRNKVFLGFAFSYILVFAITFIAIYIISDKYRREEFYQRLEDRTITTFTLLLEVEQIDHDILQLFDKHTINKLYEEKTLIFDHNGKVIYASIDDTRIDYPEEVLRKLQVGAKELEMMEGEYELVGIRFEYGGKTYFGITKAFDRFGRSKLQFLGMLLLITFFVVAALFVFLARYLSGLITKPLANLATAIDRISPEDLSQRVAAPDSNDEVGFLAHKFNELLDKVESAFRFQYHFIHHLSHELKTPLAVMMTNAERSIAEGGEENLINSLQFQKNSLMELSNIINAMLEISKTETQAKQILTDKVRIDELLFECMDEINLLNNSVRFDFRMDAHIESSENLTVLGNYRMLKMALMNLLKNAVHYSTGSNPIIEVGLQPRSIEVSIENDGAVLEDDEHDKIFRHLYRGRNSRNVKGFGLGLVLTHRITMLHRGTLHYEVTREGKNRFLLTLPIEG